MRKIKKFNTFDFWNGQTFWSNKKGNIGTNKVGRREYLKAETNKNITLRCSPSLGHAHKSLWLFHYC